MNRWHVGCLVAVAWVLVPVGRVSASMISDPASDPCGGTPEIALAAAGPACTDTDCIRTPATGQRSAAPLADGWGSLSASAWRFEDETLARPVDGAGPAGGEGNLGKTFRRVFLDDKCLADPTPFPGSPFNAALLHQLRRPADSESSMTLGQLQDRMAPGAGLANICNPTPAWSNGPAVYTAGVSPPGWVGAVLLALCGGLFLLHRFCLRHASGVDSRWWTGSRKNSPPGGRSIMNRP